VKIGLLASSMKRLQIMIEEELDEVYTFSSAASRTGRLRA
jgi:hypothetical protein